MTTVTTTALALDLAPLSGTIGAEIRGLDLHHWPHPEEDRRRHRLHGAAKPDPVDHLWPLKLPRIAKL